MFHRGPTCQGLLCLVLRDASASKNILDFFKFFFRLFSDIDSISWCQDSKIVEVQFTSRIWPPICCTRTTKGSSIVSIEPISTSNLIIIQFQLGFQDSLFEAMRTRYCAVKDYWKKIWDGEITIGRNPKTFRRHRRHCKWKFMVMYLLFSHFDFDKEMSPKWPHTALKSKTTLTWVKWACTQELQK